jgi:hypothetical protein
LQWDFKQWKYGLCTQRSGDVINQLNYGRDATPFSVIKVKGRFGESVASIFSDEM